ncbi:MAG: MBOAT family protein [Oscillospiraceae bacterium]|nr:MBOAT family protein [Oscillospiraceae bacterium]
MLFSAIPFLYYFLPITLIAYFAVPKACKNAVLLAVSLIFYAWGEPRYVFLMAGTILIGYVLGIAIEHYRGSAAGRAFTALSVVVSLGFLAYFKYADFFLQSFHAVTGLPVRILNIALPIGISFYTFQLLSYTIDVSRGERAQKNLLHLATYITMFPQLIAGPIVRYQDIASQLTERTHTLSKTAYGIRRFIVGLGKKVLIANALGELVAAFCADPAPSVLYTWLYAISFSLQIYYDFSGYSDMAIGLGQLFGFRFVENFDHPFVSKSITEFWRRWHISLGTWFRDYLYIPLGGNRVSKLRWFLNIFIVWMATGLWHGAAWNFVLWGLYFAVLLVAEKLFLLNILKKSNLIAHVYTLLLVILSFVLFNAASLSDAVGQVKTMLGFGSLPLVTQQTLFMLRNYAVLLVAACVGAAPLVKNLCTRFANSKTGSRVLVVAEPLVLAALLLLTTASLVNGSFNPFLYFRF